MTQIFVLNSAYGLMTAVAAMDAGALPASSSGRILVAVNAAIIPEAGDGIVDAPHLAALRSRFDRVIDLNELLAPERPPHWRVTVGEAPVLERLLRQAWGIGDHAVELFLQSPQVAPSRVFIDVFMGAPVSIVGDGLMTYSPIRNRWPHTVAGRVVGVVYADTVPGVEPLLFAGATRAPVGVMAFGAVVDEVARATLDPAIDELADVPRPALVLGQYLSALKLVSAEEERRMQRDMIDRALAWEPETIVFKPHPSAAPALIDDLDAHAAERGVAFRSFRGDAPAEVLALREAAASDRADQLARVHLARADTALWVARTVLGETAAVFGAGGSASEGLRAARARTVVAEAVETTLAEAAHALGPLPLVADEAHARRVADLQIYLRQHHGERDVARIGADVATGAGAW